MNNGADGLQLEGLHGQIVRSNLRAFTGARLAFALSLSPDRLLEYLPFAVARGRRWGDAPS